MNHTFKEIVNKLFKKEKKKLINEKKQQKTDKSYQSEPIKANNRQKNAESQQEYERNKKIIKR